MISLENVHKTYQSGPQTFHALKGIDLTIEENEFIAIMGPSGSGKSTLMNILGCLDKPSSGRFLLAGKDIQSLTDDQLSHVRNKQIGFVFQQFHLMPRLSALQNVMLPFRFAPQITEQDREFAEHTLDRVGLSDKMHHKPNELSGGQRQRVAIARALVNKPTILLADEPTGNLDSKTSVGIMDLFIELHQQGQTIVFVTHEDEVAQFAQRTVYVRDGLIIHKPQGMSYVA